MNTDFFNNVNNSYFWDLTTALPLTIIKAVILLFNAKYKQDLQYYQLQFSFIIYDSDNGNLIW